MKRDQGMPLEYAREMADALVELDAKVAWNGKIWQATDLAWRGRWLLTLLWPRNGGLVRDVPAQQVQPAVETAGRQPRHQKPRRPAGPCVSCPSPTWYLNRP
jgi:hypothetical protein